MAMLPRAKGLQLFAMVAAANGKYLHATKSISTKKAIKRNVPFHFKFDGMPMGIISIFSVEIYTIRIVGYLGIAAKNDISLNQIWYDSIGRQPVGRPSVNIIEGRGQSYTPDHKHLDYLARMSILYVKYANKQWNIRPV